MVKTQPSNAGNVGSIPAWGAKIPQASWPEKQNLEQKQYIKKNEIKNLKMVHIKSKTLKPKRKIEGQSLINSQ